MASFWRGEIIKILILGGTRFTGKITVEYLIKSGFDITIISKNKKSRNKKISHSIFAERKKGLQILKDKFFDFTIDFICSGYDEVEDVYKYINPGKYILISTSWLTKDGNKKNFLIHNKTTEKYLYDKKQAEKALLKRKKKGFSTLIIRLPILSGINDHTNRIQFYQERILDKKGLILVNKGKNKLYISYNKDIAKSLVKLVKKNNFEKYSLIDALPKKGITLKNLVSLMSKKKIQFFSFSHKELFKDFSKYLKTEPFWNNINQGRLKENLFQITNSKVTSYKKWISELNKNKKSTQYNKLRKLEIDFLNKRND